MTFRDDLLFQNNRIIHIYVFSHDSFAFIDKLYTFKFKSSRVTVTSAGQIALA